MLSGFPSGSTASSGVLPGFLLQSTGQPSHCSVSGSDLPHKSVLENLRLLWRALGEPGMLQPESAEAALAFLDDCESVL